MVQGQTCPKVFVGDPYQQIYGSRGAVNALDAIEPTHTFYLTEVLVIFLVSNQELCFYLHTNLVFQIWSQYCF